MKLKDQDTRFGRGLGPSRSAQGKPSKRELHIFLLNSFGREVQIVIAIFYTDR